jgi:hypothetical protein
MVPLKRDDVLYGERAICCRSLDIPLGECVEENDASLIPWTAR